MQDFTSVFFSNEFLMVYVMIGIMVAIVVIAFLVDRKPRKSKTDKQKVSIEQSTIETQVTKEEEIPVIEDKSMEITELDQLLEPTQNESLSSQSEVVESNSKEEIKYVDEEQEKYEAQKTLERLTEELKKQEEQPVNIELTNFELEQENTAIISLEELMKKADTLYQQNEVVQYEDEGNEPINLKELEERMKGQQESKKETVVLETFDHVSKESTPVIETTPKKFKNSPVISPVYGIEKEVSKDTDLELENTANYEKLDEEIRKTNEFLQILKELQKKLD